MAARAAGRVHDDDVAAWRGRTCGVHGVAQEGAGGGFLKRTGKRGIFEMTWRRRGVAWLTAPRWRWREKLCGDSGWRGVARKKRRKCRVAAGGAGSRDRVGVKWRGRAGAFKWRGWLARGWRGGAA